jgi:sugar (pentulose or hexulose) kinase
MEISSATLGIELGSTRIKATLIEPEGAPIASGSYGWENRQEDGMWTYDLEDAISGIGLCMDDLRRELKSRYGEELSACAGIGISGMMHGYLALDDKDNLLVPFRTWRNNITADAAAELTGLFGYPIPQRWSIAHLYQAILNKEEHLPSLNKLTTLAGYVHLLLTGKHVIGIGEASGMFPIDVDAQDYDRRMIDAFESRISRHGFPWKLRDVLPTIVPAGEVAGALTAQGAAVLDAAGTFHAGVSLCPPEGDADTGMVATNAVRPRSGNVSAGTSVFAMIVLEKVLSRVHEEIDLVVTPHGKLVAMVHSNNCTSDIDAWVSLLVEAANALGAEVSVADGFARLMPLALQGETDAGSTLSYGYVSGEHITGFTEGRPLFVRRPEGSFTLANFIRSHLFSSLCALRTGLDILTGEEGVTIEEIRGHGGFFKTPLVGQRVMAAATRAPVSVMETAGEGGAWGMALLAGFMVHGKSAETLPDYLDRLFADDRGTTVTPDPEDVRGFGRYFERYTAGLPIERAAVDIL